MRRPRLRPPQPHPPRPVAPPGSPYIRVHKKGRYRYYAVAACDRPSPGRKPKQQNLLWLGNYQHAEEKLLNSRYAYLLTELRTHYCPV